MPDIRRSVGVGGVNRGDDVKVVQTLLNEHSPSPVMPLTVDGVCGRKTMTQIAWFQQDVLRMHQPDARVDPGGRTIRALNDRISGMLGQGPPPSIPRLLARPDTPSDTASAHGEIVQNLANYIDNAAFAVAMEELGPNYIIYYSNAGSTFAITISPSQIDRVPRGIPAFVQHVFPNVDAALQTAANVLAQHTDEQGSPLGLVYVFVRQHGGAIVPTRFSPQSTPRIFAGIQAKDAHMREVAGLLNQLVSFALVPIAIRAVAQPVITSIRYVLGRGGTPTPSGPPSRTPPPRPSMSDSAARTSQLRIRTLGRSMVEALRRSGRRVRVNLGGAGEVTDAINVNNQAVARRGIPNLIEEDMARIGDIFDANSIDELVSNRLPPNTINWARVIEGAKRILKPGGKITIRFQGVGSDSAEIVNAFRRHGFRDVVNLANAVFEAVK